MVPNVLKMGSWDSDNDRVMKDNTLHDSSSRPQGLNYQRSYRRRKPSKVEEPTQSPTEYHYPTDVRDQDASRRGPENNCSGVCVKTLPPSSSSSLSSSSSSSLSSCLVYTTASPYRRKAPASLGLSRTTLRLTLPRMLVPPLCFYLFLVIGSLITPCAAICPNNCTCNDVTLVVQCRPSTIDVLPFTFNPALQQLAMYGTEIHTLDINSFVWYPDLHHVNLSKNMIMKVMPKTFEKQAQLEELHLAQNNISDLEADMFLGLSNLMVLSLRGNVIESLDGGVFIYLKQLKDLDLSGNRLETVDDQALAGLSNLRVLHLHNNHLATIPSKNLALVPDLAYLSLGGNNFVEIQEEDLQSMRTLKDLDLSGTQLGEGLSVNSFKGLAGLRKLVLEDCGLMEVPTAALSPLTKLEELHLGRNLFFSLPTNSFANNRHLYSLSVSGCPDLMYVEKDVLLNNVNIKEIVITQNPHLTYIAEDAFRFLSELSILDLHGNNIQMISENAASWSDIGKWSLAGNPIKCNCSSAWLRVLALAPNSSSNVKCASPPGLAGVPLHSTQLSDLACGMDPATQGLLIGIVMLFLVVIVTAVVVMMLYRHHGSCVHRLLKGHRLDRQGHHPYSNDNYQGYIMTPQKPVPVTEL